jgi:hypothetical protein
MNNSIYAKTKYLLHVYKRKEKKKKEKKRKEKEEKLSTYKLCI